MLAIVTLVTKGSVIQQRDVMRDLNVVNRKNNVM